MAWKQERVSMPMTSAGIIGVSSDIEISGIKMDPRTILVGVAAFIVLIKVLTFALGRRVV